MALLNFKNQFAEAVKLGHKKQTIRAERKKPFKVGERLYLYTGLRTKKTKKLGEAVVTDVTTIIIRPKKLATYIGDMPCAITDTATLDAFAIRDGFKDYTEMADFFRNTYGLPFEGTVIKWRLQK